MLLAFLFAIRKLLSFNLDSLYNFPFQTSSEPNYWLNYMSEKILR